MKSFSIDKLKQRIRVSQLAALTFLAVTVPTAAQNRPWTLRDCIDYAIAHNISVQQQTLTVQQGEIELNTARSSRLPGVSASASENFSFGRGLTADNTYDNTNTTSTGFNIGANMPIFQGFEIQHNIALGKLNLASATADLEKIKDDIRVAVAQAYVQILYDIEISEAAERQISIDSLQTARLSDMLANGKASTADLAQQKAALAQSLHQRTQALSNLQLAYLTLSQLLELPSPDGLSISRPADAVLEPQLLPSPEDIYAKAVAVKPSIAAEEKRLDAASTRIALAKSALYPSLSLSGGLGTNYYTASKVKAQSFSEQIKNNFSQYAGLSLSIPIFSRFSVRNSIRSARLNYDAQQLQLENARKTLYKEIQQAYYNALASQSKYLSSKEALVSAQESFDLVSAKYENGKATVTEFNESKNNLLKAQSDLAQARYEHLYQTRLLNFYEGAPLDF